MNTLNISFDSINAVKKDIPKTNVNVTSNIGIDDVTNANIGVDKTNTTMKIAFTFATKYSENYAEIILKGNMIVLEESKLAKTILDNWKKNKKLDKDFATIVLNNLMAKSSMESVLIAKELGLPSPIQLPRVRAVQPKPNAKKAKK